MLQGKQYRAPRKACTGAGWIKFSHMFAEESEGLAKVQSVALLASQREIERYMQYKRSETLYLVEYKEQTDITKEEQIRSSADHNLGMTQEEFSRGINVTRRRYRIGEGCQ